MRTELANSDAVVKPKKLRWLKRSAKLLLVIAILCCPWPSANKSYVGSDYQTATLSRLGAMEFTPGNPATLRAGIAQVDISPPVGHPLAGYYARKPKNFTDVHSPCLARALTLEQNSQKVTILTADILAIDSAVARAVLDKAGLSADEVYFTASHTHAGPGGYVDSFAIELGLGKYDARYFDDLTTKLAQVIKQSRLQSTEVEMGLLKTDAPGQLENRIDKSLPTYDKLSVLVFREVTGGSASAKKPLAILVSFAGHPTIVGPGERCLSSGYPGALVEELKQRTGAKMVYFAAGALGDARPHMGQPGERIEQVTMYGEILAELIASKWSEIKYERQLELSNVRLAVDLPSLRVALSQRWRLSPLFTFWLPDHQTHIHLLRVGPVVLAGFPADYSGELALELDDWLSRRGLELVPTSFNGSYRGYFVSSETFFKYATPETRAMNWFGPWTGNYFNELAKRIIEHTDAELPRQTN